MIFFKMGNKMEKNKNGALCKTLVDLSYVAMVTMNAPANILPINNMTTGEVSDSYPSLFTPAGQPFQSEVRYTHFLPYTPFSDRHLFKRQDKGGQPMGWQGSASFLCSRQ
jgi:hypothetical protein